MGIGEIITSAGQDIIQYIFTVFQIALGGIIEGLLRFLTKVITRTPYPSPPNGTTPLVFGVPQDALWGGLYGIYTQSAQPYAYVLWMFALIAVQFTGIFEGLLPNKINTEESKRKLMVAFLGITLWWPAGVMILGFSDALGTLLMTLGTPGESDSLGLARTYDIVMANLELNNNIGGLYITSILWLIEFLILTLLAILWFIRIAAIYILMPLMPVFIALWALKVPGLDPLQKLGGMAMKTFNTLAFITIPGALIVGFVGTIVDLAAKEVNRTIDDATITTSSANGSANDSNSYASVVEPGSSATADPVGAFSSAMNPETGTTSVSMDPSTAQTAMDASASAATAGELAGGMVASLLFAIIIMSLPIIAGVAPIIMAKSIPGFKESLGAASFLANPVGSAVGAATSVGSALDKKDAVKDGYSMAKAKKKLASDGEEEMLRAYGDSDLLDDDDNFKSWSSLGGDRVEKIKDAHSAGGLGAAFGMGSAKATGGVSRAGDFAGSVKDKAPGREEAFSAYGAYQLAKQNRGDFARHAWSNAENAASHVSQPLHDKFNAAEREYRSYQRRKGVKDFVGQNYNRMKAVKNGETAAQRRMRQEKQAAQDADELDVAQMASVISPHADAMDEEVARNDNRFGVAATDAEIGDMRVEGPSINIPEIQYTNKNEVSVDDVSAFKGETKQDLAYDAVNRELGTLKREAEQIFDDVDVRMNMERDGDTFTGNLVHNMDEDQLNTEIGQQIQEMEEVFDGPVDDLDFDELIEDSRLFDDWQNEVFEDATQEVVTDVAEQVADQMEVGFDISEYVNHETGHIPEDVLEEMTTAINKHGQEGLDDFAEKDVFDETMLTELSRKQDNADQLSDVMAQLG